MLIIKATDARSNLYNLIDETAKTHQPISWSGKEKGGEEL